MEYRSIPDITEEEMVEQSQKGDTKMTEYLLEKYKGQVKRKAKALFILGGDTDDLIQEGMIGLFKALRDFNKDMQTSFGSFADLCISRQMYTAVEAAGRKKHGPLNSYVSLNEAPKEGEVGIEEKLADPLTKDPQDLVIDQENVEGLYQQLDEKLSKMEQRVIHLYLEGLDYHQIGEKLGKKDKSIDNALNRIRKKVQEIKKSGA